MIVIEDVERSKTGENPRGSAYRNPPASVTPPSLYIKPAEFTARLVAQRVANISRSARES